MQAILKKEICQDVFAAKAAAACIFMSVTVLSGFIRIPVPMSPVPVTMQTFFVLLSGAWLGGALAGASQIGYLALGILGAPVFSSFGSGLLYLAGPTGGYMAGFVLAAFMTGMGTRYAGRSYARLLALFLIGDGIILFCGALWLKVLTGYDAARIIQIGVLPFIPGDLLKAAGAAAAYKAFGPRNKF